MASSPGIDQLNQEAATLFHLLVKESDLTCILIAGGYLDSLLDSLLKLRCVPAAAPASFLDRMDFARRIDLAFAVGLIPETFRDNLVTIRRIRNHFAHTRLQLSFEDPDIAALVRKLSFPPSERGTFVNAEGEPISQEEGIEHNVSEYLRDRFLLIVMAMTTDLLGVGRSVDPLESCTWNW